MPPLLVAVKAAPEAGSWSRMETAEMGRGTKMRAMYLQAGGEEQWGSPAGEPNA